jgi:xylan 1,4-beta-xylosidase
MPIQFECDLKSSPEEFPHFWEHTVGSGHATLALRADWQKQIERCHRELGFKYVRFHGLLDDDMGTLVCENDKFVDSFFNADQIFDFLLSIGMRPFVELSFMPLALSSGGDIVFHYKGNVTPPKDYNEWEKLMSRLFQHWVDRHGIGEVKEWFFEVWNEPNLTAFWTGTQQDYFRLYECTARAAKAVDKNIRVGGPATAANAWIPEFLDFAEKNKVPVDFISTHHYPTDAFGKPGDDTIAQLAASRRSVLREQVRESQKNARGKPVYYTEWSTSSNPFDDLHDESYAAAYIAKTVMEARGAVQAYSYWTFSDIFEENYFSSEPFHGGFGLLTIHGIPKPAYRTYQILHGLGKKLHAVTGTHETVDAWLTQENSPSGAGTLKILLVNSALPRHDIKTEFIEFRIRGGGKIKTSYLERIDEAHANPRAAWIGSGGVKNLSPRAVEALEVSSKLVKEPVEFENSKDEKSGETILTLKISIPEQAVVCVTVETE